MGNQAHEELQELEDPLVSQDVESVPADGVDDRKTVDLVLDQRVDGFKNTAGEKWNHIGEENDTRCSHTWTRTWRQVRCGPGV